MSVNVFKDPTSKVPDSDPRIQRVAFNREELGARESHLPKGGDVKNNMSIDHVKQGR